MRYIFRLFDKKIKIENVVMLLAKVIHEKESKKAVIGYKSYMWSRNLNLDGWWISEKFILLFFFSILLIISEHWLTFYLFVCSIWQPPCYLALHKRQIRWSTERNTPIYILTDTNHSFSFKHIINISYIFLSLHKFVIFIVFFTFFLGVR